MASSFFGLRTLECSYSVSCDLYPTVIPKDHLQRPNGIEVIDLDGDGTTAMLHIPTESDQIMDSLTAHKNEVKT